MSWSDKFSSPVELSDGTKLKTLKQAGEYLSETYGNVVASPALVGAVEDLIAAAESGEVADLEQAERQLRSFLAARPGRRPNPIEMVREAIARERARTSRSKAAARRAAKDRPTE